MKLAFVIFALLCIALPIASPQTFAPTSKVRDQSTSSDEADIRQVSDDWVNFYNAGEAAKVAALSPLRVKSSRAAAKGRASTSSHWPG